MFCNIKEANRWQTLKVKEVYKIKQQVSCNPKSLLMAISTSAKVLH